MQVENVKGTMNIVRYEFKNEQTSNIKGAVYRQKGLVFKSPFTSQLLLQSGHMGSGGAEPMS